MTTEDENKIAASQKMQENLARIEQLTERMVDAIAHKRPMNPALEGPGADLYLSSSAALMKEWLEKPSKILEAQVSYWGQAMKHYMEAQEALSAGKIAPPENPGPADPRFKNPLWDRR